MDIANKFNDYVYENGISGSHIEIFSNKKITVEGCYGINEYNEDIVRVNMPKGEFIILGKNLEIKNMENKNITVCGVLISFEFSGENI